MFTSELDAGQRSRRLLPLRARRAGEADGVVQSEAIRRRRTGPRRAGIRSVPAPVRAEALWSARTTVLWWRDLTRDLRGADQAFARGQSQDGRGVDDQAYVGGWVHELREHDLAQRRGDAEPLDGRPRPAETAIARTSARVSGTRGSSAVATCGASLVEVIRRPEQPVAFRARFTQGRQRRRQPIRQFRNDGAERSGDGAEGRGKVIAGMPSLPLGMPASLSCLSPSRGARFRNQVRSR